MSLLIFFVGFLAYSYLITLAGVKFGRWRERNGQ